MSTSPQCRNTSTSVSASCSRSSSSRSRYLSATTLRTAPSRSPPRRSCSFKTPLNKARHSARLSLRSEASRASLEAPANSRSRRSARLSNVIVYVTSLNKRREAHGLQVEHVVFVVFDEVLVRLAPMVDEAQQLGSQLALEPAFGLERVEFVAGIHAPIAPTSSVSPLMVLPMVEIRKFSAMFSF